MAPRRRIFLHIGTHKTATTTIQKGCCDHRAALLEAGWLYPTTGMYIYGQHNVAWEMCSGHPQPWNHVNYWVRYRPEWGGMQQLLDEIENSTAPNVIISSEDFDGLQTERIFQLRDRLKDFQVEVIVYLREQASFLQSAWAQFVKSGYIVESFPAFVDRMLASGDEVLRYFGAYDAFLQPWMDAFGADSVHPRQFSRDVFRGHVFHDFLACCGVPNPEGYQIPDNQNISPGYKSLEMIRLMGQDVESLEKRSVIARYLQHLGQEMKWDHGKLNLIGAQTHDRIQARFSAANRFLQEKFNSGEPFFSGLFKESALSQFNIQDMPSEEWEEIARSIATYFVNERLEFVDHRGEWKE